MPRFSYQQGQVLCLPVLVELYQSRIPPSQGEDWQVLLLIVEVMELPGLVMLPNQRLQLLSRRPLHTTPSLGLVLPLPPQPFGLGMGTALLFVPCGLLPLPSSASSSNLRDVSMLSVS